MKKFINRMDYLWKGDRGDLSLMWLAILLAIVSVASAVLSGLKAFNVIK